MVMAMPHVFCVKKEFPATTGQEFLEVLAKNPDKYTYAADGIGGSSQLIAERIFYPKGAKARAIPYSDAGTITTAFLGGQVDIYTAAPGPIVQHMNMGQAKCLLISSKDKNAVFPQAQSAGDVGVPDAATTNWRGVVAPAGTPADRIAILEKAFVAASKTKQFRDFAEAQAGYPVGSSGNEFGATIDRDLEAIGKLVDVLGIRNAAK
jgi:tripartite-type tricarboxylate transporter receptor subunit TctC